jgi:hypothetical protein
MLFSPGYGAPFGEDFQLHSSWILNVQSTANGPLSEKRTESFRRWEREQPLDASAITNGHPAKAIAGYD